MINNPQLWSFITTVFILLAASVLSSKKQELVKVRLWCWISYSIGCITFTIFGYMINDIWVVIQNLVLLGLDIRGIINCLRLIKNE